MKPGIVVQDSGAFMATGRAAAEVIQATVLAKGLELYARTGMLPNRLYTPKNMRATAEKITGLKFKARDYIGMANALIQWAQGQVTSGKVEVTRG